MRASFLRVAVFFVLLAEAGAYEEVDVPDGGTISGQVKFAGPLPELPPIPVVKDPEFCGDKKPNQALVVSRRGGVKYAVVYLDGPQKGKPIVRNQPTDLNQEKCLFDPHVFAMVRGTDLSAKNSDPILHNANMAVEGVQMFNFGQPRQGMVVTKRVRKSGRADVTCDSHNHMRAYFLIFDHPYFAVTDEDGHFKIDRVPPGQYELKLWHESWRITGEDSDGRKLYDEPISSNQTVEVKPNGSAQVNFTLKP